MRTAGVTVTIAVCVTCLMFPVVVHAAARNWIAVAPESVKRLSGQIKSLEGKLSLSASVSEKSQLKRSLVGLLVELADQSSYAGLHSEHISSLSRAETIRGELEDLGQENELLYQDYYDHAYFLANVGFGAPLRSVYYMRRPEPDYPLALTLFQKASEGQDINIHEGAQEQIRKITSPVVALGVFYYSQETLILTLKARNLGEVIVKVGCVEPPGTFERQWSALIPSADDHRVETRFYSIGKLSFCKEINARAEGHDGSVHKVTITAVDKGVWGVRGENQIDQPSKIEVPEVSRLSISSEFFAVNENHAMNQGCSLCHIPHSAGE